MAKQFTRPEPVELIEKSPKRPEPTIPDLIQQLRSRVRGFDLIVQSYPNIGPYVRHQQGYLKNQPKIPKDVLSKIIETNTVVTLTFPPIHVVHCDIRGCLMRGLQILDEMDAEANFKRPPKQEP